MRPPESPGEAEGRWLAIAALGAVIAGAGLLGVAVLALGMPQAPPPGPTSTRVGSATPAGRAGSPSPTPTGDDQPRDEGITAAVDAAWADALADDLGIPRRVFRAYAGAPFAVSQEYPRCGLGWNTLAGIGLVESHHATISGGGLDPEGRASPPIHGIALDGSASARIPDTDDGVLDGDSVWDRAVGPMQFIPSTWERWGSDGNADGVADPQQIDDAVYPAARYLCAVGGDLRKPANWIEAVAAYNRSVEYNNRVADAADGYARRAESLPER